MVSLGMKIVYNQSVHCDKCNFRKKQNIFETMRFLRYWQLPWYVPLPRMFPSTNLFLWILTTTITSQVPLPIVGWETWLTSSSLACHINRGIPSWAIHLTSCILSVWFSIAQCAVCKIRCSCIQNVSGYYMYIYVYDTGA